MKRPHTYSGYIKLVKADGFILVSECPPGVIPVSSKVFIVIKGSEPHLSHWRAVHSSASAVYSTHSTALIAGVIMVVWSRSAFDPSGLAARSDPPVAPLPVLLVSLPIPPLCSPVLPPGPAGVS